MPLLRYFLYVGGALLALLFISNATLPQVPLPSTLISGSDLPTVRIHSDRKWPERVVFDTNIPTVGPLTVAKAPAQPTLAEISAKGRVRDAFAQLPPGKAVSQVESRPSSPKNEAMAASQPNASQPNKTDLKQPKRKVAKARPPGRPVMLVAQQPHYGMFDTTW